MKKILLRLTLFSLSFFVISLFLYYQFLPIYKSDSVIFPFAITPFDIAKVYPKAWYFIKKTYFIFLFISYFIVFNYLYSIFQKYINIKIYHSNISTSNNNISNDDLQILIGKDSNRKRNFY